MTPEIEAQAAIWRVKSVQGTITLEEMQQAIIILREGRLLAATASEGAKRKKAKEEIPDADSLLGDL